MMEGIIKLVTVKIWQCWWITTQNGYGAQADSERWYREQAAQAEPGFRHKQVSYTKYGNDFKVINEKKFFYVPIFSFRHK